MSNQAPTFHSPLQDPAARPSAAELLEHEFVRHAQKPPALEARVAEFLRLRPGLTGGRRNGAGGTEYGTVTSDNYGTVPRCAAALLWGACSSMQGLGLD